MTRKAKTQSLDSLNLGELVTKLSRDADSINMYTETEETLMKVLAVPELKEKLFAALAELRDASREAQKRFNAPVHYK